MKTLKSHKCSLVVVSLFVLTVNGKSYGTLNEGDHVAVDHGKIRVNLEVRAEAR